MGCSCVNLHTHTSASSWLRVKSTYGLVCTPLPPLSDTSSIRAQPYVCVPRQPLSSFVLRIRDLSEVARLYRRLSYLSHHTTSLLIPVYRDQNPRQYIIIVIYPMPHRVEIPKYVQFHGSSDIHNPSSGPMRLRS